MRVCKKCNKILLDDSRYCTKCGDKFYQQVPEMKLELKWVGISFVMQLGITLTAMLLCLIFSAFIYLFSKDFFDIIVMPLFFMVFLFSYLIGNFYLVHISKKRLYYEPAVGSILFSLVLSIMFSKAMDVLVIWQVFFFGSMIAVKTANYFDNKKSGG
jgi:RNA polymerase subunit RPABC4/transcription elongation factor Spt4